MGRFSQGEQSQLNAMRLYAQNDNCDGVRRALSSLGSIVVHVGNLDDGLAYLRLATLNDCGRLLSLAKDSARRRVARLGRVCGRDIARRLRRKRARGRSVRRPSAAKHAVGGR